MNKLIWALLCCSAVAAHAKESMDFSTASEAISQGKKITFVIDFNQCHSETPIPKGIVLVRPDALMLLQQNRITASHNHFTLNDPLALGIPTLDYTKYDVKADGTAQLKITVLNAKNYEQLSFYQINCKLGEGFNIY